MVNLPYFYLKYQVTSHEALTGRPQSLLVFTLAATPELSTLWSGAGVGG